MLFVRLPSIWSGVNSVCHSKNTQKDTHANRAREQNVGNREVRMKMCMKK